MEQVAHQAVVMQFIIEMAKSCNVDPRGCFRLFFQRAKVSCIFSSRLGGSLGFSTWDSKIAEIFSLTARS